MKNSTHSIASKIVALIHLKGNLKSGNTIAYISYEILRY